MQLLYYFIFTNIFFYTVAGGLHVNTVDNIVDLIAQWGFNAIRIPW